MHLRAIVVCICVFTLAAVVGSHALSSSDEFTVVVLPDTQFYSRSYPEIFRSQTQWIADNAAALRIKMVVGVGDVVQNGESDTQYHHAHAAVSILDRARIPYVLPVGNHDYMYSKPASRDARKFNQYFGPARYSGYTWYRGGYPAGSNENFYATLDFDGRRYLVLALEFSPRAAALEWASQVLAANRDREVIVTTHSHVNVDDTLVGRCDYASANDMGLANDNDGDEVWQNFLSRHPNIVLTLSGHVHGVGRRSQFGVNGNLVNQVLSNYQHETRGGNGYLRILTFRPSQNRIEVRTYSPYVRAWRTDARNQFTIPMYGDASAAGTGYVTGHARGADCRELAGATVSAAGVSVHADRAGLYTLPANAPNTITVRAADSGWESALQTTPVRTATLALRDFYLRPALPCPLNTADRTVTICTPGSASNVTSPVLVTAGTTSSYPIRRMTLYVDGVKLYENPDNRIHAYFGMATGSRRVTVRATDDAGASFSRTVYFAVASTSSSTSPPVTECALGTVDHTVSICTPSDDADVASPVRIVAGATSSTPVKFIQIYVDGAPVYTTSASTLDTSISMALGTRRVTVQAKDVNDLSFKKTIYVNVTSTGGSGSTTTSSACSMPSSSGVNICSPAPDSTLTSMIRVTAAAHSSSQVTQIALYLDGVKVYHVYSDRVDTFLGMGARSHRLTVQAKDASGRYISKTVNFTVALP
jgi:hypothetical protein